MANHLIEKMTKDCARDNCSLTEHGTTSTCMGFQPTYDKRGNRTDAGDPNIVSTEWRCQKCLKRWVTRTQYGKTEILAVEIAKS